VNPRIWKSWVELEVSLSELGEPFLVSPDAERTLWDVRYPTRTVLVFGRESVGLPPDVRDRFRDRLVRVPMADPELRSLNLSTCVAVVLYEVVRQRNG
jgi:tRNA (cytidine/uridine-2'-O-)-methyltransferase